MPVKRISPEEARELIDKEGYAYLDVLGFPSHSRRQARTRPAGGARAQRVVRSGGAHHPTFGGGRCTVADRRRHSLPRRGHGTGRAEARAGSYRSVATTRLR